MNQETFDIFVMNVGLLNSDDEKENRLKRRISGTFKNQYERL